MKKNSINICICTCLREELLVRCLRSVSTIRVPENAVVTVTVIDNDSAGSVGPLVTGIARQYPFPLNCYQEPRRGIPFARNRAIDETIRLGSDYLVFIDDDEWVESDWLIALYDYCQSQGGSVVVSGNVVSELHPDVAPEIRALHERKVKVTGERLRSCATNNVLIPMVHITQTGLRFNESNPLAGGEDTMFFVEAVARGVTLLKCAEAVVHESVPLSRSNLRWLSVRKFRAGITEAWRKRRYGRSWLRIAISSLAIALVQLMVAGLAALSFNKVARNGSWLNVCKSVGVLYGLFGGSVEPYRKIDR